MTDADSELLARFVGQQAEDAFAEIVRRHLGLVYSAALRQVRSPQLAEEVAQSAFIKLAQQAARLKPDTILTAWLYQVTRHAAIDVVRREASRQLREQIATEMNAMNATAADWTHIEPLLDEAMHALDDTDRTAVLLRYFENKSLREVGATLGTSENAAQKRLGRAVERLREFFAKRGITVGARGVVVVISANAVQAAPVGLAVTISAAALAGTAVQTSIAIAATKAIAMTATQKVLITTVLAAAVGTGICETRQASIFRHQVSALQQQQTPLTEQLTRDRNEATRQLAALRDENDRLNRNTAELPRLRNEVTQLRQENQMQKQASPQRATTPEAIPPPVPVKAGEYLFKDQLAFAGYATPEASVQSSSWAWLSGNYEASTNALGPRLHEEEQKNPKSRETFENGLTNLAPRVKGMQILARKDLSDEQVEIKFKVDINIQPASATVPDLSLGLKGASQIMVQPMVKVGNEWKMGGTSRRYTPDWDKSGTIQNFVP